MNLFVYGTLLVPRVVEAVTSRSFRTRPATLHDYARYRLAGVTYPGLVPEPGARTEGALLEDVDPASLDRLDAFEGSEYEKVAVTVGQVSAITYVLRAEHRHRSTGLEWELDPFVARDLARFLGEA